MRFRDARKNELATRTAQQGGASLIGTRSSAARIPRPSFPAAIRAQSSCLIFFLVGYFAAVRSQLACSKHQIQAGHWRTPGQLVTTDASPHAMAKLQPQDLARKDPSRYHSPQSTRPPIHFEMGSPDAHLNLRGRSPLCRPLSTQIPSTHPMLPPASNQPTEEKAPKCASLQCPHSSTTGNPSL